MSKKPLLNIILFIIVFFIGVFSGISWHNVRGSHPDEETIQERQGSGYAFINPLIECEIKSLGSQQKYIPFEKEAKEKIKTSIIEKNPNIEVSVYFRNLRNGPWFGINEEAPFAPASLMKLPVAMAYLKWAEVDPVVWGRSLTGIIETGSEQNIVPEKQIQPGSIYSAEDVIRYSLIYSDNNANQTLINNIPTERLLQVFRELAVPIIDELQEGKDEYISVKEYASFFRILYNSSYLSRASSEFLLTLMSQVELKRGIRKSVPEGIPVSHKFGERGLIDEKTGKLTRQFHDCGIVYYSKYPYLLCVMTKGDANFEKLEEVVEQTAKVVHSTIEKTYP